MKKIHYLINLMLVAALLTGCAPKDAEREDNAPRSVVIGVSPFLRADQEKTLLDTISWLTHQPNCQVSVYDGWQSAKITEFKVPMVEYFKESAVAQKIGEPLQKWIAWSRSRETNSNPSLSGSGAVNIPKLLDRLAQEHASTEHLIIIGSPVARFPSNTDYDFAEPNFRYPSDSCIRKDSGTPFSCAGREHALAGTRIYFLFPTISTEGWPSDYENKLNQFYGRYFASRSGNLMVFTPDLKTGFKLVNSGGQLPFNEFKLSDAVPPSMVDAIPNPVFATTTKKTQSEENSMQTNRTTVKLPPVRPQAVASNVSTTPPIPPKPAFLDLRFTGADAPKTNPAVAVQTEQPRLPNAAIIAAPVAQAVNVGPKTGVVISIRYQKNLAADVDFYLRPFPDSPEICFNNADTAFGHYTYSFDATTQEHVKSIYLPAGCDAEKAVCWLNYRTGYGLTTGTIIWSVAGGQKSRPFSFFSLQGGDSDLRREFTRKKSNSWLKINLLDLMTNGESNRRGN